MSQQVHSKGSHLAILGEMTIYHATGLRDQLRAALESQRDIQRIDLGEVTEMDTAGVQLLLGLWEWARRQNSEVTFSDPSPAVREVLELLQITLPAGAVMVKT